MSQKPELKMVNNPGPVDPVPADFVRFRLHSVPDNTANNGERPRAIPAGEGDISQSRRPNPLNREEVIQEAGFDQIPITQESAKGRIAKSTFVMTLKAIGFLAGGRFDREARANNPDTSEKTLPKQIETSRAIYDFPSEPNADKTGHSS